MKVEGIDISHHQGKAGKINYETVAAQNFRFIIHKSTEGATYQDPMYHYNRQRMPFTLWGAYHLMRPDSPDDTRAEVDNFLTSALWRPGDLPPALDLEHKYLKGGPPADVDVANIRMWTRLVQEALGVWPMLYISPRGFRALGKYQSELSHLKLWLADYDDDPTDEVPEGWIWTFWQNTSNGAGRDSGFASKGLDKNQFNGDIQALHRLASGR